MWKARHRSLDSEARKQAKLDGRLNHPADGHHPPPSERQYVAHAHVQAGLHQADDATSMAKLVGARDSAWAAVQVAAVHTEHDQVEVAEAKRVLDLLQPEPSARAAALRYAAAQLMWGAVDAAAISLTYYVFRSIQPWESFAMAGGLATALGATADWYGSGAAETHPRLAKVGAAAVGGTFAGTGYIRGAYFATPHSLIGGVPANPFMLAIAMAAIGAAIFVFTAIASNSYHQGLNERRVWAHARRRLRQAEKALQHSQTVELAARQKHAVLAAAVEQEPVRQRALQRVWFARFAVTINHYRSTFLRTTGDGRPRGWMTTDPDFTLDLRAAVTMDPLRDLEEGTGERALPEPDDAPSPDVPANGRASRNGRTGAMAAAAVLGLSLLTASCSARRGTDHVVLFDVSDNGWPNSVRAEYIADARKLVGELHAGDCISFDVIRARADDQQFPVSGCLGLGTSNPMAVEEERGPLADSLIAGVTELLKDARRTPNSPLAEAIAATPHRFTAHPKLHHVVTVLTDGVQQGDVVDVAAHEPTPAYIDSALARMKKAGGIADLHNSRLRIATVGGGEYDRLPQERHRQIKAFWVTYAKAANAVMDPDADYGPLLNSGR